MDLCECGAESHEDQRDKFPIGVTVKFMYTLWNGKTGIVVEHCSDGRAVISIDGDKDTHTFHYPPFVMIERPAIAEYFGSTLNVVELLADDIAKLRAENERLRSALIEAGDVLFTNEVLRFRATRLVGLEELEAACEVINQALKGK